MKSKILTSLVALLSACSMVDSAKVESESAKDKHIEGYKLYTYDNTKDCGEKNNQNRFIRKCEKESGEFITGVIKSASNSEKYGDSYTYYKDGFEVKYISYWKNGNVRYTSATEIDAKNLISRETSKTYFKTGELSSDYDRKIDLIKDDDISYTGVNYYKTGVKSSFMKGGMNLKSESWNYDTDGSFLLKGERPYKDYNEKESEFDRSRNDIWVRYDKDGKPYNGIAIYHFDEYPDKITSHVSLKNGKRDGVSEYFYMKEDGGNVEHSVETYKDGVKISIIATPFDKENNSVTELYYFDNARYRRDIYPTGQNKLKSECSYNGIDGEVTFYGSIAEKLNNIFEKDKTKNPCPVLDFVK
ncbi:hypothetical protein HDR60_01480 [bacterium]|nr:hypothetical protein [bacterium]